MERVNVLVTGAGAVLGQGVLRSLREARLPLRLLTADPDHRASGHWLGDHAFRIPMARDPEFLAGVEALVEREGVRVLIPGTDVELAVFAEHRERLEARYGMHVLVSPPRAVEIADDKFLTARFLAGAGLPFARSAMARDADGVRALAAEVGFPLFAKPARGARSYGARPVRDERELEAILAEPGDLVVQEHLPEADGEYTAGSLTFDGEAGGVVVLRRDLRDGNTYRAYADTSGRFDGFVRAAAEQLGAHGPCNFQFRVRGGEPVVFEINARFSGTTPLRAVFGFNEVEAALNRLLLGEPVPRPTVREGAVLRAWSDVFVPADQLDRLARNGDLPEPRGEAVGFETPRAAEQTDRSARPEGAVV